MADNRQNDDLDRRIANAKAEIERPITAAEGASESRGWAIGIEFVGVILVSTFIGYAIDTWTGLGTKPWAMIGFLVLGFIAGVYRAMKTSASFDANDTSK
ncbi:MAG: AtpZ/AtpI family protein [Pseudomonadota bacterium]